MRGERRAAQTRPTPMRRSVRLLALPLAALLLGGCGSESPGDAAPEPAPASSRDDPPGTQTPTTGDDPALQPPIDSMPTAERTGPVRLGPKAPCEAPYSAAAVREREFAFAGTVTAIDGSSVTFEVDEWFVRLGDDPSATTTVGLAPASGPAMSESAPAYSLGTRLLVSGDGASAWGCGFTRYFEPAVAQAWRS